MKWPKIVVAVSILSFIALFAVLPTLPERLMIYLNVIPLFNFMASKWAVLVVGVFPFAIVAGMVNYQKHTKKNAQVQKNQRVENIILPAIALLIVALPWISVLMAKQKPSEPSMWIYALVGIALGIFMIVIGNYMGIVRQNKYLGYKTRWAMKSEEVWRKTNRTAAYLSVIGGGVLIVASVLSYFVNMVWVFYAGLILSLTLLAVVPYGYSYVVYRALQRKEK